MASESISKLKKLQAEAEAVLNEHPDVVRHEHRLTRLQKFLHFWALVGRSFVRNRCPVRASALAYSSLLALIPMLAVALSVTTSILKKQGEEPIRQFVNKLVEHVTPYTSPAAKGDAVSTEALTEAATAREDAVRKINEFINRTQSGAIGVTGMIALVFVAIMMLARIEGTFNDIWGVMRGRSWGARIVIYWAAITLGPVALIAALGLTSGPHLQATKNLLLSMPFIGSLVFEFLPLLVLSGAFALLYLLLPNTKVHWQAAVVGGLVAGLLWHLNNVLSVHFVSRITSNNAIYGSLGMVPVFMVGLYFSWIILLFGAQVAYAYQNRRAYFQEKQVESVSPRGREFIGLRLMTAAGGRFARGERAPTALELADALGVPSRLIGQIIAPLMQAKLLMEVAGAEAGYAPSRPLNQISCHDILLALRSGAGQELETKDDPARATVAMEFEKISQAERDTAAAVTVEELVKRADKTRTDPAA